MSLVDFFISRQSEILNQLSVHLYLTFFSLFITCIIGIALGIYIISDKRLAAVVLGIAGIFQTIPSIALLGLFIPLLGIGTTPAIVALILYALLPIVRNTYTGITEVNPSTIEAAKGMGMSKNQILREVQLPLAFPVIFAGIRTAAVINVGVATLAAYVGAGGLGQFIFRGIAMNNSEMMFAGAIPAALLAIVVDFILGYFQKNRLSRKGKIILAAMSFLLILIWLFYGQNEEKQNLIGGFHGEFIERPDGLKSMMKTYDFEIKEIKEMNVALLYDALHNNEVDIICGFATDGRMQAYNFTILEDDLHFFFPYYAAPLVNEPTLQKYPELKTILNKLAGILTDSEMSILNAAVDLDGKLPETVAKDFLNSRGFETTHSNDRKPVDFYIGSKNFTESFILANLFEILIENYSDLNPDTKLGLAGTKIIFEALTSNEIGLYPEYTGTAFQVLIQNQPDNPDELLKDSDAVYEYVNLELTTTAGVQFLKPLGFNNTYAIAMRSKKAEAMGLVKLSDLKGIFD